MKNENVLVTGGTGLVGRELVEMLVKQGAYVTSISMDENNFPEEWGVEYAKEDLRDPYICMEAVDGQDYVFHIAGMKGSPVVVQKHTNTLLAGFLQMNTNMIQAMYHTPTVKWGLYCSTIGTYGPAEVFHEDKLWDQNPSPNDWYAGWGKRMGELLVDSLEKQYGKRHISIIKPVNIYGSYDNFDLRTSTLVPSLVRKVHEAIDSVEIWGTGEAGRDIIHARDVASAALYTLRQEISQPVNVGWGRRVTIKDLITTLVNLSGKDLEITHDLSKPTGDLSRVADVSRLRDNGWEPRVSLADGLRETLEWYSNNTDYSGRWDPFSE